jgi:hypothetical protein
MEDLKNLKKSTLQAVKVVILALVLSVGAQFALAAWTAPTSAAPAGNVEAPVNTGVANQIKAGGLGVGNFVADAGAILGNFIIGTQNNQTPEYLKIDAEQSFDGSGTTPLDSDCAAAADYGRMITNYNNRDLYICMSSVSAGPRWHRIHAEEVTSGL